MCAEGETEGLTDPLGEIEGDSDGLTEKLGEIEGLSDELGLKLGLTLELGDLELDGDFDGDTELEGLILAEGVGFNTSLNATPTAP